MVFVAMGGPAGAEAGVSASTTDGWELDPAASPGAGVVVGTMAGGSPGGFAPGDGPVTSLAGVAVPGVGSD